MMCGISIVISLFLTIIRRTEYTERRFWSAIPTLDYDAMDFFYAKNKSLIYLEIAIAVEANRYKDTSIQGHVRYSFLKGS